MQKETDALLWGALSATFGRDAAVKLASYPLSTLVYARNSVQGGVVGEEPSLGDVTVAISKRAHLESRERENIEQGLKALRTVYPREKRAALVRNETFFTKVAHASKLQLVMKYASNAYREELDQELEKVAEEIYDCFQDYREVSNDPRACAYAVRDHVRDQFRFGKVASVDDPADNFATTFYLDMLLAKNPKYAAFRKVNREYGVSELMRALK